MECEYIRRFIRKRLTEMETVIIEGAPVYEGNVDVREDILHSDYFMISYGNGFFYINFEYGSPVTYVAAIMKKLAPKFELSVGEPYYFSGDGEMYCGDECRERYLADLRKELIKERAAEAPSPQSAKKDKGMRN